MNIPGINFSQKLFVQNEKQVKSSDSVSDAYNNLASLSGVNSMPQEIDIMKSIMPAYASQSRLSTYFQDSPWGILTESNKYGLPTMGGEIIPDQPPGYRPGNTLRKTEHFEEEKMIPVKIIWS